MYVNRYLPYLRGSKQLISSLGTGLFVSQSYSSNLKRWNGLRKNQSKLR